MLDAIAILTAAIETQDATLRASIPDDREAALVALVQAQDRLLDGLDLTVTPPFDPIHGARLANSGGSLALSLALAPADPAPHDQEQAPARVDEPGSIGAWADSFLAPCADVADARQVLAHLTSGFMRGGSEVQPDGSLHVWIAQKRFPPAWRERIDLAWLDARTHHLNRNDAPAANAAQLDALPDAVIAGLPARTWAGAVETLVTRYGDATSPIPAAEARNALTEALPVDPDTAASILAALTLDAANAAWHATVPGIASAPFVRLTPDTLMPSRFGLRTDPLRFLARELRRRDAQGWHNAAHQRETAFRHDLATVFADKRFVHAPTRIQLKREGGSLRTDIDAAIFDRKTGTLALFELKAQDPFSRSPEELERRRDNVLAANRQVSGILDWTTRHRPDEILDRIDRQTAKRFHVQRALPFVLARTLVRFNDGPTPDKRAAWGTWPDVLRLHDAGALDPASGNPLQTLFSRLHAVADAPIPPGTPPRTLRLGGTTVIVAAERPPSDA